ncbi:DUF6270 domain-containing protein [Sporolactobacillus vineae]|uniref:DUF6270 domain-containing protein n=1 Tax=Sporolactobacillus vineae TaxID=444463 RepID=UPI00028953A2|nr:DUF6270 domain-containing protein [Sporolactobacillus vineae]
MNKIRIAEIGSCVSRDPFNSKFVPNYKDFFEIVSFQNQMSTISLMADPIPYDAYRAEGDISQFNKENFLTELDKSILYRLLTTRPDYLILDFYGDVYYGAREVNGSFITNKIWMFEKVSIFKELHLGKEYKVTKDADRYFNLWKQNADAFMRFMQENLPDCKIIVNKARFVDQYYDHEQQRIQSIAEHIDKPRNLKLMNEMWDRMDCYLLDHYSVRALDYGEKKYLGDENHLWGLFFVHYTKDFYLDFRDKLLKIVFDDLMDQKTPSSYTGKPVNLIRNSTFDFGKSYWSYWEDDFKIVQNTDGSNSVRISESNEEKNINRQIWSNPVEIKGDSRTAFTVSFEVKIRDLKSLDDKRAFFAIRVYQKIFQLWQKNSLYHTYLTVDDYPVKENEWTPITFTFRPDQGRYIKVAPYLFRNGDIEWRNIQVEAGPKATAWKPGYQED